MASHSLSGLATNNRDPRLDFFDRLVAGDQTALDDFVRLALDDPRGADGKLAWWLDATSSRVAGDRTTRAISMIGSPAAMLAVSTSSPDACSPRFFLRPSEWRSRRLSRAGWPWLATRGRLRDFGQRKVSLRRCMNVRPKAVGKIQCWHLRRQLNSAQTRLSSFFATAEATSSADFPGFS